MVLSNRHSAQRGRRPATPPPDGPPEDDAPQAAPQALDETAIAYACTLSLRDAFAPLGRAELCDGAAAECLRESLVAELADAVPSRYGQAHSAHRCFFFFRTRLTPLRTACPPSSS